MSTEPKRRPSAESISIKKQISLPPSTTTIVSPVIKALNSSENVLNYYNYLLLGKWHQLVVKEQILNVLIMFTVYKNMKLTLKSL